MAVVDTLSVNNPLPLKLAVCENSIMYFVAPAEAFQVKFGGGSAETLIALSGGETSVGGTGMAPSVVKVYVVENALRPPMLAALTRQ